MKNDLDWLTTDKDPIEPHHIGKLVMLSIDPAKAGIKTDPPIPNLLVYGRVIEVRWDRIKVERHATLADDPVSEIPYDSIRQYCWGKETKP